MLPSLVLGSIFNFLIGWVMKLKQEILIKLSQDENIQYKAAAIVLIHIAKRQNNSGQVNNLHYTEICEETGYTRTTFYDTLRSLENGGYISVGHEKRNGFYDIKIAGNSFNGKIKDQYLNLNDQEILSTDLKLLSTAELKIYLYGRMTNFTTENRKNPYSAVSVTRIAQIIGIKSHYLIKRMIENIKQYTKMAINIEQQRNKPNWLSEIIYLACPKSNEKAFSFDDFAMYYHDIKAQCKRAGIDSGTDDQSISDAVTLINQYHKRIDAAQIHKFLINTILKRRSVEPKYLNMLLRKEYSI